MSGGVKKSKNKIKLFEKQQVRAVWDEEAEKWWFSVVDVVAVLTEQGDYEKARNYWKWLKKKLVEEGSELVSNTNQLKMEASDGKKYLTDAADTEQVLRLIQSIPSKKAEPFKMWLAKVGNERIDETIDPEQSIDRAIQNYRRLGYSENWINQRIKSIEVRKALTDEWDKSGVKKDGEYALLTDLMSKTWSGMNTREYKKHKGLKKENLRDNMTNTELVLNIRPPQADAILPKNNHKLADQKLGAAVFQEMQILRFLNASGGSTDTAAAERHEAMLQWITQRGNVTRTEVEAFYRSNIRALISETVDEEFRNLSGLTTTNRNALVTNLTAFLSNPNAGAFNLIVDNYLSTVRIDFSIGYQTDKAQFLVNHFIHVLDTLLGIELPIVKNRKRNAQNLLRG